MKGSAVVLFISLVCMLLASAVATAGVMGQAYLGEEPPRFAFGFRASVHDIAGIPFKGDTFFPEELNFDTDIGYGFSAEYWLSPSLSLELAFDHVKIEDTYGEAETVNLGIDDWAVSVKYTFSPNARLRPYVLAGFDIFLPDIDYFIPGPWITGDVDSTWGWHLGGGAEYRFTDNLGIFAELRYRSGQTDVDTTMWYPSGAWSSTNEVEYDGFVGTIGLKIYW